MQHVKSSTMRAWELHWSWLLVGYKAVHPVCYWHCSLCIPVNKRRLQTSLGKALDLLVGASSLHFCLLFSQPQIQSTRFATMKSLGLCNFASMWFGLASSWWLLHVGPSMPCVECPEKAQAAILRLNQITRLRISKICSRCLIRWLSFEPWLSTWGPELSVASRAVRPIGDVLYPEARDFLDIPGPFDSE